MQITNKLSDEEIQFINDLIVTGKGETPDENGKVSDKATHMLLVEDDVIVGAVRVRMFNKPY
jgi:hypothetical protein